MLFLQKFRIKRIAHFIGIFLFFFFFSGYGQEPTPMQQVITAHDEVMAKMPNLVKLINALHPKVDSTKSGQKYQAAIDDLKTSNKSMMTWMQGFGSRFTADEMLKEKALSKEKQQWLVEEKKKIETLRKEITTSIKNANKLLEK